MDLICLMINLKFSFRFNFFYPIYLKLSFQRRAWLFHGTGYFHVWNYKTCPGKQAKAETQLPSAVYLEFPLSVRDHQTLNCMNLDLKFNFLICQWLLLCILIFLSQLVTKNSLGAVQDALGRPDGKVTFDFLNLFHWSIIDLQCWVNCVISVKQSDSIIHTI